MKRGGLALAALLLVTGALRWMSPGGSSNLATDQETATTNPADKQRSNEKLRGETSIDHGPYAGVLEDTIQAYYGEDFDEFIPLQTSQKSRLDPALRDLLSHWNVPKSERGNVQFVVALLPDPVHTRLSLSFDRGIETIQQAAQEQSYNFDRATMPWDDSEHPESNDFVKRGQEAESVAQREAFPGLMIFRARTDSPDAVGQGALFVLVVGETPTGGINKKQFANALAMICEIQDCLQPAAARQSQIPSPNASAPNKEHQSPLLILGPSSTGSLYSLQKNLELNQKVIGNKRVFAFSGTIRATGPRCWFQAHESKNVRFLPFQDGEEHVIEEFLQYAKVRGYAPSEVAILSENETEYGDISSEPLHAGAIPGCPADDTQQGAQEAGLHPIQFPRGISRFRAAYQKQVGRLTQSQDSGGEQRPVLPLSLEEKGDEDDTVASYAKIQTPLSQEAVMLGIINRLHQHHPKLVILRTSDPVDELFLLRYLRQNYPQGRVVVTAPDLLFARDDDGLLHGVLAIGAYSLAPGSDQYISEPRNPQPPISERAFPSSSDTGAYNAMVALLALRQHPDAADALFAIRGDPELHDLPLAPYAAYGGFQNWRAPASCLSTGHAGAAVQDCGDSSLAPGIWISILGRDGYWMAAALPRDAQSALHQINADALVLSNPPGPHTPTAWIFAYSVALLLLFLLAYFICTGTVLSGSEIKARFGIVEDPGRYRTNSDDESTKALFTHRRRRARLLAWAAAALTAIAMLLAGTRYALVERQEGKALTLFLVLLPLCFVFAVSWNIHKRRGEPEVAWILFGGLALLGLGTFIPWIGPLHWITSLTAYRAVHLTSGVSPLLPFLLLIAALCGLAWYELHALAVTDCRSPRLPSVADLSQNFYRVSEEYVAELRHLAMSLSIPMRVFVPILCFLSPIILLTIDFHHAHPVQTIEGAAYDWLYALTLLLWLILFLGCLTRLVVVWNETRRFLSGLDTLPLRDAFKRLQDFSWTLLWSPSGSALRDTFKFTSREIENLRHLQNAIRCCKPEDGPDVPEATVKSMEAQIDATFVLLQNVQDKYRLAMAERGGSPHPRHPAHDKHQDAHAHSPESGNGVAGLMEAFATLQRQLAKMAGVVMNDLLAPLWGKVICPVASAIPPDLVIKKNACQLVAEEYVSLVYASFLASVLLRMRSLVMEAIAIYFFIVLSISCYPFEPNPAMFTLALILILVMGVVIGYVYSQMHRDSALSRLTSTTEGERGVEFWLQFLGAGAIPVLSLLAAQFPTVSRILIDLLQPLLQTTK